MVMQMQIEIEKGAESMEQLYGVADLAAKLKVPRGYVTPMVNRGIFLPTHRWGSFRLFTQARLDEIVREHGPSIRVESSVAPSCMRGKNCETAQTR
jgi:hypothetical protein